MQPPRAVDLLSRTTTVLKRWWWIMVLVGATSVGIAYAVLDRVQPIYRATSTVVVSPSAPRVLDDVKDVVDLADGGRRDFDEYMQTQLDIMKSQAVADAVLDRLDLWDDPRLFGASGPDQDGQTLQLTRASDLAGRIKPRRVIDSLIIQIQFEHKEAELAAIIANEYAEVYVLQNLSMKRGVLDEAKAELFSLLEERRETKLEAEQRNTAFETKHDITAVETRRKEVANIRAFYNQKVLEATAKLVFAQAQLDEVKKVNTKGIYGIAVAEIMANPVLNELKVTHTKLRNEVSELAVTFLDKHPKLVGAKERLGQVSGAIQSEIKGILRTVEGRADSAREELAKLNEQFEVARLEDETLGKSMTEYDQIQKELKEQTALFDRIRKRYEETVITTSVAMNNVRVLDRALVPEVAIWPRRTMVLTASALFGLMLGGLLVLLLERADTTIRDKAHAEETLDIPCLGLIPTINLGSAAADIEAIRERDLYVHHHALSEPAEQARTLRTNLLFLSAERKLKTMLITSAMPEEGKTTIAIQTSITLASAGGRVILIEADMRRPRIAPTLSVSEERGLSTFLASRDVDVRDIIQRTEIPNLDVIVCGLIPPNPAELLNSLRLNQLIARLHEQYDMVVIDSPPVNAVSDALVMASRVDGVLLVAKSKRTTAEALRTAYQSLLNIDAPVVGTVLNDVHRGAFGYYRKGKYYRRGYYKKSPEELEVQSRRIASGGKT
jgi:succinoglycan biosynthesis transport protein ExoP